ncbi:hypothetical protein NC796_25805 [Aliifodinibius sp. S!AR15-10]|uniref:hypothetical protein n=1 Tax=Aliifodinibius sp. S!AR15-10 TaxID=2950437 RepID=UPI002861E835|nr:hypothetical protein [Aliifodinibius sp. S!AR15-10]MDR8394587.1 hypothetical protein [Aliifodinibius sp. S!AR15-10]
MDSIIGSIFFEFIGASIKWIFYTVKNWIKGEKYISFGTIYSGDESDEFHEQFFLGVSNIWVGLLFIMGIIVLLVKLGI